MADSKDKAASASAEVDKHVEEAEGKGFIGVEVDQTPNEEYSMERPNSWKVPEADPDAAKAAGSSKFSSAKSSR